MADLTPKTRIEYYLAKANGQDVPVPQAATRLEMYLRKIAGEEQDVPTPVTRLEMFLAKIAGEDVTTPTPVTRLEMFLDKAAGGSYDDLVAITRLEMWIDGIQSGETGEQKTATGTAPLSFTALAHALISLTQYGKVTQASTPTPSSPKDIVCNNGALKAVDDELPAGYKRLLGFVCDNNAMWQIAGFKLKGSDTVRISFSVNAACNVFGCYQGADADDNYDLYVSTTSGSKYFRYGSGTYLSYWSSANLGQRFDVVYTPTGSSGMPQDSTWTEKTFTSANDLLIGSTTTTGTSSKLKGNLYGNIIVDGRLKLIPCERVSDGVLGYYDTYSETFYEPYEGFDGAVSLGYDGSHYSLTVDGTSEVLSLGTQTASVADLFAVGDYKDTQELIGGTVTRRVVVRVMTGAETSGWSRYSTNQYRFVPSDGANTKGTSNEPSKAHILCNRYKEKTSGTPRMYTMNSSSAIVFQDTDVTADTIDAYKEKVAAWYASGEPLIVIYPLATATTEQVTPQSLHTTAGGNVVSVVSNVDPVALEVVYMGSAEEV